MFNKFFPDILAVYEKVEKYGTPIEATDDNTHIMRRMRFACRIIIAKSRHTVIIILTYCIITD